MSATIYHRDTRTVLYRSETAADVRAAVEEAIRAGADLSHADLRGARLKGADFSGANLTGANLEGEERSRV